MNQSRETFVHEDENYISFGERMIASDGFRVLFREGMLLVEETAAYLDGDGRSESRDLPRTVALAYATESMRLTTRLMQIASWLLIQRAANEGEMNLEQAQEEKQKVKLSSPRSTVPQATYDALPACLRELIDRAARLQERVQLLDSQLDRDVSRPSAPANPIGNQLALLKTAFANDSD